MELQEQVPHGTVDSILPGVVVSAVEIEAVEEHKQQGSNKTFP